MLKCDRKTQEHPFLTGFSVEHIPGILSDFVDLSTGLLRKGYFINNSTFQKLIEASIKGLLPMDSIKALKKQAHHFSYTNKASCHLEYHITKGLQSIINIDFTDFETFYPSPSKCLMVLTHEFSHALWFQTAIMQEIILMAEEEETKWINNQLYSGNALLNAAFCQFCKDSYGCSAHNSVQAIERGINKYVLTNAILVNKSFALSYFFLMAQDEERAYIAGNNAARQYKSLRTKELPSSVDFFRRVQKYIMNTQ